jgi:hypothetical protein
MRLARLLWVASNKLGASGTAKLGGRVASHTRLRMRPALSLSICASCDAGYRSPATASVGTALVSAAKSADDNDHSITTVDNVPL